MRAIIAAVLLTAIPLALVLIVPLRWALYAGACSFVVACMIGTCMRWGLGNQSADSGTR